MNKAEKLQLTIAQAEIVVRLLAEGKTVSEVAEACDLPVDKVEAVSKRLDRAEARGVDKNQVASMLSVLIKKL